jgi:hypothetical protein
MIKVALVTIFAFTMNKASANFEGDSPFRMNSIIRDATHRVRTLF